MLFLLRPEIDCLWRTFPMTRPSDQEASKNNSVLTSLDWPALALFFLLATAFWIPPLPYSLLSLSALLRITWLTVLLAASYLVLFRRKPNEG
jgi:hypothetical protein